MKRLNDWKTLRVDDKLTWQPNEPHAKPFECVVAVKYEHYALATTGDFDLWIDDDTINQFLSIERT